MAFTSYTIIVILIIFILILFTLLLFHVGRHTQSNRYLGIYFISQIVVLLNMAFHFFPTVVYCLIQSVIFSWGAFYYLFVSSLLNKQFTFKPYLLLHFIPVPVGLMLLLVDLHPVINQFVCSVFPFFGHHIGVIHASLFNVLIIGYNIATISRYYQFRKSAKKGLNLKNTVHPVWLTVSVWGFVISCFIVQIGRYLNQVIPSSNFDWQIIGLTAFLIYFCVLFYVAIVSRALTEKPDNKEKYKNSSLPETDAMQLLKALDDCMVNKRLFTNQELKIKELAEQLNTSERNLSQIINKYKNQNFSDYINSFRINYAKELLANHSLNDKTILWILFESGFNSKSTFNTLFKKVVGFTPAEYRKTNNK